MDLGVIIDLDLDGQIGHWLARLPVQASQFHRDQQYQIPPEYSQDGIVLSRGFLGSTDAAMFEDFVAQLLQHCGRWPEPKSVLIMGDASFHHSDRITELDVEF